jgi:hypothetical protein
MNRDRPTQAFAARDAHEALLVLKEVVDDAAKTTHPPNLNCFLWQSGSQDSPARSGASQISRLRCCAVRGTRKTGACDFSLGRFEADFAVDVACRTPAATSIDYLTTRRAGQEVRTLIRPATQFAPFKAPKSPVA